MSRPDGPIDLDESEDPFSCSYLHDRAGTWRGQAARYDAICWAHAREPWRIKSYRLLRCIFAALRIFLCSRSHRSILAKRPAWLEARRSWG